MGRRACEACGRTFVQNNGKQRFCSSTCRSRGFRGASVIPFRDPVVAAEVADVGAVPTLVAATRAALEAADRLTSPAGVRALLLASDLDRGGDTGSARAALSKAHGESLADALSGAVLADDGLDELRVRRGRRLSG